MLIENVLLGVIAWIGCAFISLGISAHLREDVADELRKDNKHLNPNTYITVQILAAVLSPIILPILLLIVLKSWIDNIIR